MTTHSKSAPPLNRRFKLLYGMGDLVGMPFAIIIFFQLFFLTDVAGMEPAKAGLAVGIGKLWDSINDPLFGVFSDRIKSKFGRRRIVMVSAVVPMALAFCFQFLAPVLSEWGQVFYYTAVFIIFDTLYTAVTVSYNALTPAITQDYDERSSINSYRMTFSILGGLIPIIFATILSWYVEDLRQRFMILGIVIGIASIFPMLVAVSVTEPFDTTEPEAEPMAAWSAIQTTLSNKTFLLFSGLFLFSWTTASFIATILIYFANYYMQIPDQANYIVLIAQVSAIGFIPFWGWVARKYDKRRAFMLGCASWVVVSLLLSRLSPTQVTLAYILAALAGAGIATSYFLPWAMLPDIVELDELQTGQRREGIFYAFASFIQKLGTGFIIWGFGLILSKQGYISPEVGSNILPAQPASAVAAIQFSMGVVPAILLVLAIVCAWYYPITREKHSEIVAELMQRRMDEAAAGD